MKTLRDAKIGETVKVVKLHGEGAVKRRIAFIMDRIFRRFGLSGKSFSPMLVGTGCGIPGVMASRTISSC